MGKLPKILKFLGFVGFIVGLGYVTVVFRYEAVDAVRARNFQPSTRVNSLKETISLTDKGNRIFLASKPEADTKAKFSEACPVTEKSLVLGCYSARQIFVLNVDEPRLSGVMEVTAAHELLHAAYERLLPWEKTKIDALVDAEFKKVESQRLKDLVGTYKSLKSTNIPNELHSIIGTEVRILSPELESYYSKYFKDRKKIVGLSEKYEGVFTELQQKVEMFDGQIEKLKSQIDVSQALLESDRRSLDSTRTRMNSLLSSGKTVEYNALVGSFNQNVKSFNSKINQLDTLIKQHNDTVNERNAVVIDQRGLSQSLDSTYKEIK
jgi:hypothetical protein